MPKKTPKPEPRPPKSLIVYGIPEPQARPQYARGHFFSPKTYWWHKVYHAARLARPKPMFEGPIKILVKFFMPRPAYVKKTEIWHGKRPDIDNILKGFLDAVTKAGWWLDDGQVADIRISKRYAPLGTESKTVMWAEEIGE